MEKRVSSRAIIIEDNKLLAMFRRKIKNDGSVKEYYVIPGGGLEENETLEENVIRELKEEFSVDIEELERMTKENYYEIKYIDLKEIDCYDINAKDIIKNL